MQDSKYWPAEEAKTMAQTVLIPTHHTRLAEARIAYLFVESLTRKGKDCLAKIKRAGALERYLGQVDYVVTVNHETWQHLTEAQRRALIDHELCHCTVTSDKSGHPRYGLRGHDLEEFAEVVERHGLWQQDVEDFAAVVQQQLPLRAA